MNIRLFFFILIIINLNTPVLSNEVDCNQFDKLSAKYIECTAKKMKEKASDEINKGKKKLNKSGLGEKINKFKKSKTLSDLIKG
jgi:hypothetical protein|tara:strand:- start:397 stop:648 length:252 start_codon:yes stop_codon:yes gene_type:complete